ncbi:little elongation complex subunit 1 isoform X1 [Drosophila novamexicana]|uniref:little elongation complex subunit 1 isoform X1 n=1 Tax=Drosophila novamexicana TaxID=47314 RepID=UPI0011E5DCAB|nr:little elongation complex subunit 1 isoform X1 [Drosophila novamexicana]
MPENLDFEEFDFLLSTPQELSQNEINNSFPTNGKSTKKRLRVADLIASNDELVRQVKELQEQQKQLCGMQRTASEVTELYQREKQQRIELERRALEHSERCVDLEKQLDVQKLNCEHLQEELKNKWLPVDAKEMIIIFMQLAQRIVGDPHASGLTRSEHNMLRKLKDYCKSANISIPAPKSPTKKRSKGVAAASQSTQTQPLPILLTPPAPTKPEMCSIAIQSESFVTTRDQGIQHKNTTTTRGTTTASFIQMHDVGTCFPEPKPALNAHQILDKVLSWTITPLSPIGDQTPPTETLPTISVGTCTDLCNVQREIDFLPQLPAQLKRSDSRPPSRAMYDSVKDELAIPADAAALDGNSHHMAKELLSFLPHNQSVLAKMPPQVFEEVWQVMGQMVLVALQSRSASSISQADFRSWFDTLYETHQAQNVACSSKGNHREPSHFLTEPEERAPLDVCIDPIIEPPPEIGVDLTPIRLPIKPQFRARPKPKTKPKRQNRRARPYSRPKPQPQPEAIAKPSTPTETAVDFLSNLNAFHNINCDNLQIQLNAEERQWLRLPAATANNQQPPDTPVVCKQFASQSPAAQSPDRLDVQLAAEERQSESEGDNPQSPVTNVHCEQAAVGDQCSKAQLWSLFGSDSDSEDGEAQQHKTEETCQQGKAAIEAANDFDTHGIDSTSLDVDDGLLQKHHLVDIVQPKAAEELPTELANQTASNPSTCESQPASSEEESSPISSESQPKTTSEEALDSDVDSVDRPSVLNECNACNDCKHHEEDIKLAIVEQAPVGKRVRKTSERCESESQPASNKKANDSNVDSMDRILVTNDGINSVSDHHQKNVIVPNAVARLPVPRPAAISRRKVNKRNTSESSETNDFDAAYTESNLIINDVELRSNLDDHNKVKTMPPNESMQKGNSRVSSESQSAPCEENADNQSNSDYHNDQLKLPNVEQSHMWMSVCKRSRNSSKGWFDCTFESQAVSSEEANDSDTDSMDRPLVINDGYLSRGSDPHDEDIKSCNDIGKLTATTPSGKRKRGVITRSTCESQAATSEEATDSDADSTNMRLAKYSDLHSDSDQHDEEMKLENALEQLPLRMPAGKRKRNWSTRSTSDSQPVEKRLTRLQAKQLLLEAGNQETIKVTSETQPSCIDACSPMSPVGCEQVDSEPIEIPLEPPGGEHSASVPKALLCFLVNAVKANAKQRGHRKQKLNKKQMEQLQPKMVDYLKHSVPLDLSSVQLETADAQVLVNVLISAYGELQLEAADGSAQERLLTVIRQLECQSCTFIELFMNTLEQRLFSLKERLTEPVAIKFVKLSLQLIGLQASLTSPVESYVNPARLLLAKILYHYSKQMSQLVLAVLCHFPTVLPHREERDYDHADPLITVIKHLLMSHQYNVSDPHGTDRALISKLRFEYHFQPFEPTKQQVIENLVEKIKAGRAHQLSYAFALFCRRSAHLNVSNVLAEHLLPLANSYCDLCVQSEEYDARLECLLQCISMIVKQLPLDGKSDISGYIALFKRILVAAPRPLVQQAAVQAILRTQRFGYGFALDALQGYRPSYQLTSLTRAMLRSFVERRHQYLLYR